MTHVTKACAASLAMALLLVAAPGAAQSGLLLGNVQTAIDAADPATGLLCQQAQQAQQTEADGPEPLSHSELDPLEGHQCGQMRDDAQRVAMDAGGREVFIVLPPLQYCAGASGALCVAVHDNQCDIGLWGATFLCLGGLFPDN